MFSKSYIKRNIVMFSLFVFIVSYFVLNTVKPKFLYNDNMTLRQFGVGYRKKTVLPLWLISIVLAILSYFSILYYVTYNRIQY
jgi:hypothetical protein